jgi:hypothetical protein
VDEFVKIGVYRPVKDEKGARPAFDEAGERREVEFDQYARLEGVSIKIDPEVSAETRRVVDGTIARVRDGMGEGLATVEAINLESAFQSITKQTVVAIRDDESGKIKTDAATLETFFKKHMKYGDIFPILGTIRHALDLSSAKKKSWSSLFE